MKTKKILIGGLLLLLSTSITSKKYLEYKELVTNLTYQIWNVRKIHFENNLKKLVFTIDLIITNVTNQSVNLGSLVIKKIYFYLPNSTEPFAISTNPITEIAINPKSKSKINDIKIEVATNKLNKVYPHLNTGNFDNINIKLDVEIFGKEFKGIG